MSASGNAPAYGSADAARPYNVAAKASRCLPAAESEAPPRCGQVSLPLLQRQQSTAAAAASNLPATLMPGPFSNDAVFPLFELPPETVDLVLGSVGGLEEKRALRLVCKRIRAGVDSRVVVVIRRYPPVPGAKQQLSALLRAPWGLRRPHLGYIGLLPLGVAPLQELDLSRDTLGSAAAAALAAASWPTLQMLCLDRNSLGDAGAAALAAGRWPGLKKLYLNSNSVGPAGGSALARPPGARTQFQQHGARGCGIPGDSALARPP